MKIEIDISAAPIQKNLKCLEQSVIPGGVETSIRHLVILNTEAPNKRRSPIKETIGAVMLDETYSNFMTKSIVTDSNRRNRFCRPFYSHSSNDALK